MLTGSGLFLSGILTLLQFPALPPLWPVVLLPVLVGVAVRYAILRFPAWYLCGFGWALFIAHQQMDRQLAPELQGTELEVRGHVISLPEIQQRYSRFEFRITSMRGPDGPVSEHPNRIRLNWYRPYPEITPGEAMDLTVKLKRPHGFMNPGGFDYEGWLFRKAVRATGYVVDGSFSGDGGVEPVFTIHRWRHRLRTQLQSITRHLENPALVHALALGDRNEVDRPQWRILNRTGTNHLLAISGLHIGLVAAIAYFIARWLWPLAGRTALWLPAPHAAAFAALTAATAYALLAGFTVPTRRALIMLATLLLARLLYRNIDRKTGFSVALLTVLILDPLAVLSPGFWLSFAAVAVILWALIDPVQPADKVRRFARVQCFVFLGLAPLLAFWFQQVPLLSILANSLAIPWISLTSVPLILSGTFVLGFHPGLAGFLLVLGDRSLSLIWTCLEWIAALETGVWGLAQTSLPAMLAALVGTGLLLLPRAMPGKWLGIFWLAPLLVPRIEAPAPSTFRFILLDVGQGLAAVIQTANHALTYDTGPAYGSGFNTGWAVVVPYLRYAAINRVDIHVQSHADNDHQGGLEDVLTAVPVEAALYGEMPSVDHPVSRPCRAGQEWRWDGVHFRMLHPRNGDGLRGNDRSCVLRISAGGNSVLLTGDIEQRGERALLEHGRAWLDTTILVAPHHGSTTSSSAGFVRAVSPDHVLFSTGYLNRYGLPKQAIIDRYSDVGARLYDTVHTGAIEFRVGDTGIEFTGHREELRRFWHNRP